MNYQWFVLILIASIAATAGLAFWKAFGRKSYSYDVQGLTGGVGSTFIARLSWFAVPLPMLIAIAFIYIPEILRVIAWHELER